jgi:DNA-binding transcriptional ArsR family regulator
MPHPLEHSSPRGVPTEDEAGALAQSLAVFATASRIRILYALLAGERSVEQLAADVALSPNTVSQQLRVLRSLSFVRVRRDGRRAFYSLHDSHVADLLHAIHHHGEHVRGAWPAAGAPPARAQAAR